MKTLTVSTQVAERLILDVKIKILELEDLVETLERQLYPEKFEKLTQNPPPPCLREQTEPFK